MGAISISRLISGAVSGAIYSIMASGLVLTYQTSGIFNFAHGAVAFATSYLFFILILLISLGQFWFLSRQGRNS